MEKEIILYFTGIDCPNCALKVEELLNNNEKIDHAQVDFIGKKIIIKYHDVEDIKDYVQKIIIKKEPDAKVSEEVLNHEHHHHHEHDHEHECCNHEHECCNHELECCNHHDHHGCSCHGKCCSHRKKNSNLVFLIIGLIAFIAAIGISYANMPYLDILSRCLFILSFLLLAYKIIIKSLKNIKNGNLFDENFLMMVASIGALVIGENIEAIMVVLLYRIGEYYQDKALNDSTEKISALTKLNVDYTTLESGEVVLTKDVKVDDLIVVKVGERIPLDGVIVDGNTLVDASSLTGESIPVTVDLGDEVMSGCINLGSVIKVKVLRVSEESTASKIIKMVELAGSKKSKTEKFITKFAKIYTPIVLILALSVFLVEWLVIPSFTLNDALNNSFVFLVTSCPCALVISIPLAIYAGIGKCSSYGILVKGGNYLEALAKTKVICFDKTGTLTKGEFTIDKVYLGNNVSKEELFDYLVAVESYSNHPLAKSICKSITPSLALDVRDISEVKGMGMKGFYNGLEVLVGNKKLLTEKGIIVDTISDFGSVIYVSYDNRYLGAVVLKDALKDESKEVIDTLHKLKITPYILTGDKENIALEVARHLGIKHVEAELLPQDKFSIVEELIASKEKHTSLVFVGDGINDAPSLKLADVGVAIGGTGLDEAIEVSDVVLLTEKLGNLVKGIKVSKMVRKIMIENISFALLIKFAALIVGTLGLLGSYGMLLGVFADVGVCLIVILNTLRILRKGE